jgi:hypothetical protein
MPFRVALNVAYAMLTEGLDGKQRQQIDDQIYGWAAMNERANQVLRTGVDESVESGGES